MSSPRDAIENLQPEPPTPTISSISSDLSFEDIPAMGDAMSANSPDNDLEEHPTLFIREDMVKIRVQRTLFRIPLYFLTQRNTYFTSLSAEKDLSGIMHITDDDVTSSAFANFLRVLRPPFGMMPAYTLAQWTDVLHLSTKWTFHHERAVAIRAILTLASAVDKIVLGRTYDFSGWIPRAFADLLEREEDLTVEEARRMTIEDVVTVAKGRREAIRTGMMKSKAEIEQIVKGLLPSTDTVNSSEGDGSSPDMPTTQDRLNTGELCQLVALDSPSEKPAEAVAIPDLTDKQAKISRWLNQLRSGGCAPRRCLVRLMQSDRANAIPLVLDGLLERGLKVYSGLDKDRKGSLSDADEGCHEEFFWLNRLDKTLGLQRTAQAQEACLRLVNRWALLSQFNLELPFDKLTAGEPWRTFVHTTKYLIYLVKGGCSGSDYSVTDPSIFRIFWTTLTNFYKSTFSAHKTPSLRIIKALLKEVGNGVSRTDASIEMDAFYETLEDACDLARADGTQNPELAPLLDEIISSRLWPSH